MRAIGNNKSIKRSVMQSLWLPMIVLVVGLLIGLQLNDSQNKQNQIRIKEALQQRLIEVSKGVKERVSFYQYGLRGLRGAIVSSGISDFNLKRMRLYTLTRNYDTEFPGARGIGFIRYVNFFDKDKFTAEMAKDRNNPEYQIRQLTPHQDSLFVIQYITPEGRNREALGLDIGSEPMRRTAAINAALNNEIRLTAPITLVQADKKTQQGFLVLMPVYDDPTIPFAQVDPLSHLIGWTYAPLLIDEVLSSITSIADDVILKINDVTSGSPHLFYQTSQEVQNDFRYTADNTIHLYGREWLLQLTAKPAFIQALHLPTQYQILFNVLGFTLFIMVSVFCIQLLMLRRYQAETFKADIATMHEKALKQANQLLEKQVDERTAELEKMYLLQQSILEGAGYTIVATDVRGTITLVNQASEKMLGYKAEELIGKKTPEIFHLQEEIEAHANLVSKELGEEIAPNFGALVAKAIRNLPANYRWTYVTKYGHHIPVKLNVTTLRGVDGQIEGFLGISFDLTEQIRHEKALAEAKEVAEEATRVKSEFLANMSHEIRTPMNGLLGTLQLLKKEALTDKGADFLEKALYSTQALSAIINDILDFSKIEAGKLLLEKRAFNLTKLIDHLGSDLMISAHEKGIKLSFEVDLDHHWWLGDEVRLRQVLLNLISNAIKFTAEGTVTLRVEYLASHQHLRFIITDTGIGMSDGMLDSLFQRFQQADTSTTRKFGGTGLGLSISHSIVSLMQGEINVDSQLGEGSTFTIDIPAQAVDDNTVVEVDEVDAMIDLTNKTILVAEDNEINQLVVKEMLSDTHAKVYIAKNGQEAVDFVQRFTPDLVLMDIHMPVMDGVEACKILKQKLPHIPIIALTANALTEDRLYYAEVGFDAYLSKPIEIGLLLKSVYKIIGH
jgi:PAS domain S-box-containing protein